MTNTAEQYGYYLERLDRHGYVYVDEATSKAYLSLPERLPHEYRSDTAMYLCKGGEYLINIANSYLRGVDPFDAARIIAEFQEDPIIDPFAPLRRGRVLSLPSEAYIQERGYGASLATAPVI